MERRSRQDVMADGMGRYKACWSVVADACACLVRGTRRPNPTYCLPPSPLAASSQSGSSRSLLSLRSISDVMPSILVNLLLSSLANLVASALEHLADMAAFLLWGQSFSMTLVSSSCPFLATC